MGFAHPKLPDDYLGRMVSTLGVVKELRVAAGGGSRGGQHFPEVYPGSLLEVNLAFKSLDEPERVAIDLWYVVPGKIQPKLDAVRWSEARFRETLAEARGHLKGLLRAGSAAEESYG
jgi:hypothetical protein